MHNLLCFVEKMSEGDDFSRAKREMKNVYALLRKPGSIDYLMYASRILVTDVFLLLF